MVTITFLGTGSAIPTKTRNHTSIFLRYKDENLLIDCGEGTQRQLRIAGINPCKITRMLLTHLHGDHVFGIPGLLQTLHKNNYQKTLKIYGPRGTKKFIENILNNMIIGEFGKIKTETVEVKDRVVETEDFRITAFQLDHKTPTVGYAFQERDKLRIIKGKLSRLNIPAKEKEKISLLVKKKNIKINNQLIKYKDFTYPQKGKKISFIFDTRLNKRLIDSAKNSDLAIIESTLLEHSGKEKKRTEEYYHLTAGEAAKIAKKANVKKLILTHISQRYEFREDLILKEAKKEFKNVEIARDLMRIEI